MYFLASVRELEKSSKNNIITAQFISKVGSGRESISFSFTLQTSQSNERPAGFHGPGLDFQ